MSTKRSKTSLWSRFLAVFTKCWLGKQDNDIPSLTEQLSRAWPYVWPRDNFALRLRVILCFIMIAIGRAIKWLIPQTLKYVVNGLAVLVFPLEWTLAYCFLRIFDSFFRDMRSYVWLPVGQNATLMLATSVFAHLQSLSVSYHLTRKTGEVLKVIDRGTTGVSTMLEMTLVNIMPAVLDTIVTLLYFLLSPTLSAWYSLILFSGLLTYAWLTVRLTMWRQKYRRELNERIDKASALATDSLLNFETVKYFSAEKKELEGYTEVILLRQESGRKLRKTLVLLHLAQNVSSYVAMLGAMLLAGWQAYTGAITPGDFVLVHTYVLQCVAPLQQIANAYHMLSQGVVDAEKMFKVLDIRPEIVDKPEAKDLVVTRGEVEFRNINFWYKETRDSVSHVLKDVSFTLPSGKKTAVVGPTGSGKSTLGRLLYRLYELQEGTILVDGQNIQDVTQHSLRKAIGIVPQDTVLFNNSISFNIGYGSPSFVVPSEHVEHAAQVSQIYDRVQTFSEKFETLVGERGLRLSGGEKQRVAIARTVLKNPQILLLDEATSALDSQTEQQIQTALNTLSRNRTTMVIAHRLSTIVDADEILVLNGGCIVERGTHSELLALQGLYHSLWQAQLEEEGLPST
eukprot:TRINITY_DN67601_c5_g1_i1.p1 TRINITY_DN67601_c5_g1~~TRINITY_DN67601_c5_g1_i1.p1  ORF type:complete len:624 (+),score=8.33 TRINITY_DN67601_c5_g1_i1:57-1928(+)